MTSSRKKRCLLIEDEMQVGELMKLALEGVGIDVVGPVATLDRAAQEASCEAIDVALLDLAVNGGDSSLAADVLRERNIPILLHAGKHRRAPQSGGAPVLGKPLDDSSFIAALLSYVLAREPRIRAAVFPTIH